MKINDVTIDAGFFSAQMINFLKRELESNGLNYLIRMPIDRKVKRMKLWEGRRFTYVLEDKKRVSFGPYPKVSFRVVVSYDRDKQRKDGKDYVYLFATSFPYNSETILELYKNRWAIETGYRMYTSSS